MAMPMGRYCGVVRVVIRVGGYKLHGNVPARMKKPKGSRSEKGEQKYTEMEFYSR